MEYSEDIAKEMRQAWFDAFDTVKHLDNKKTKFAHLQQTVTLVHETLSQEITFHQIDDEVLNDMQRVIDNHVAIIAKVVARAFDESIKLREAYEAYKESQTTEV